jgi:poly [ADP-ribose] polymerase 2/3/4
MASAKQQSLAGFAVAFSDSRSNTVASHHDNLKSKSFKELKANIKSAGGQFTAKVEPGTTTHFVATEEQFKKKGARVKDAIKNNLPILTYKWLVDSLGSLNVVDDSAYRLLAGATQPNRTDVSGITATAFNTNTDADLLAPTLDNKSFLSSPKKRTREDVDEEVDRDGIKKSKRTDEDYESDEDEDNEDLVDWNPKPVDSQETDRVITPRSFVPVDKYYEDQACEVYKDDNNDGDCRDATLNQTDNDIKNATKVYIIQLLQHDSGEYYTWTRWGRAGDKGQSKILGDGTKASALTEFEKKFKEKTGLKWAERGAKPKSKKYTLVETIPELEDADRASEDDDPVKSKLPKQVQNLMKLIFNDDHFKATVKDLYYDLDKIPLEELSNETILEGYTILQDISKKVNNGGPAPSIRKEFVDESGKKDDESSKEVDAPFIKFDARPKKSYYVDTSKEVEELNEKYHAMISHTYPPNEPIPVLNRLPTIRNEMPLLETLLDIQVSNNIMSAAQAEKNKHEDQVALVDAQYNRLNMKEMTPLDRGSDEFKELEKYLMRSKGDLHPIFYKIQDIFRIERAGEEERFKNSRYYGLGDGKSDRRLLWHGARTANFGAILSQGLRINPFEAPQSVNGGTFSQGLGIAAAEASESQSGGLFVQALRDAHSEVKEAPQSKSGYAFGKGIYLASQSTK